MQNVDAVILAIESSCDDTSCAVLRGRRVLSNIVSSQQIHASYGGVVPEFASRDHERMIVPVVMKALETAGVQLKDLQAIAVTRGPGLMGSLLVGLSFAKSLSYALNIPLVDVNHMQAHVLAHFLQRSGEKDKAPAFPFLCLTVSGGHTQLLIANDHLKIELIGQTLDDAVGEAFDKAAKLLGLPYPGGPMIDKFAREGDPSKFRFASSNVPGNDFSFSGVKTSFMYFLRDMLKNDADFVKKNMTHICASYQRHLVNLLLEKTRKAMKDQNIARLALAGGVSANSELRRQTLALENEGIEVFIPELEFCTDNAAMIGVAAHFKYLEGQFATLDLRPAARLTFKA